MAALCLCLGIVACGGVAAAGVCFAAVFLPGAEVDARILAGFFVMAVVLAALPGILAGETKNALFMAFSGVCAAASLSSALPIIALPPLLSAFFALYGAALCFTVILAKKTEKRPPDALRLRRMVGWALVPAAAFAMAAFGMLHETTVSERVAFAGKALGCVAPAMCFFAFLGVLKPKLFTATIYLSFFLIWLLVPVAGLEAYMQAEGFGLGSAYATGDWRWTYGCCVLAFVGAVRMLALRRVLLPSRSWLARLLE